MNKKIKRLSAILTTIVGVFILSSCTRSFCSEKDLAHVSFLIDEGITKYISSTEFEALDPEVQPTYELINEGVYKNISFENNKTLQEINKSVINAGSWIPTIEFWTRIDEKTLDNAILTFNKEHFGEEIDSYLGLEDLVMITNLDRQDEFYNGDIRTKVALNNGEKDIPILQRYGYLKFYGANNKRYGTLNTWIDELKLELGTEKTPNQDFMKVYFNMMNSKVNQVRTCIAIKDGYYSNYGPNNIGSRVTAKSWGDAFGRGPIEGLLVYPVAWLVDALSMAFGSSGWGQILAILVVTIIVRGLLQAVTFRATRSQAKMTALQSEIAAIQQKYPNANTNQYEKQRLAQEQMSLYKKNGVNMFAPFLVMIFQFPIFISVWGALSGASILATDSVLGLRLSDTISSVLTNWSNWGTGANGVYTALVLFILMAAAQILSMLIPQWLQKKKTKNIQKLTANPNTKKQGNQMKIVQYVMVGFVIIMGFNLPSAMGVYWFVGALISLGISLLINNLNSKTIGKNKNRKVVKR